MRCAVNTSPTTINVDESRCHPTAFKTLDHRIDRAPLAPSETLISRTPIRVPISATLSELAGSSELETSDARRPTGVWTGAQL